MSQRFTHTSPMVLVKLALGLAAALATMFALMAATSSPAQANPPTSGCAPGVVVICDNPITIGDVNIDVLTENKILNGNQITVVKQEIEKGCGGIVQVGCINVQALVPILNGKFLNNPKVLGIVFI
jgi:hypothetical protein